MSKKEKGPEKPQDVEQKELYVEDLQEQVRNSEQNISLMVSQVNQIQVAIHQERGIAEHAKFMLSKYKLPNKPKEQPVSKKLEVLKNEPEKSESNPKGNEKGA